MRIAINTRFLLGHKMEGFGWFTYEITKRIVLAHPEHTFYFFFDRNFDEKFLFAKNIIPIVLSPQARHPILFKIWFNFSVTRALKKYKIDVFFSPDGYLSLKTNIPQIGVIHDLNFEHYPADIPKSARVFLRKYFPLFAKKANHIITVSEYSKLDIINKYNIDYTKITVAYNAASNHFKPITNSEKNEVREEITNGIQYFVYVGALHSRKNLRRLLLAFKQFKEDTSSLTKIVIVGENLWKSNADPFLEEMDQLKSEIIFTGHVEIQKLAKIVGAARALCLVSYFEGFGIPIVEAMQSGIPVLSGNLTSLPEICGDVAVLVDPFSVDSIKNGIIKIDQDQILRKELSNKGIIRAKHFNWDKSANIIWTEIEKYF